MKGRRDPNVSDTDDGSVSLYLVVMFIALMVLAGLVLDGGRALAARGRAEMVAQQAARAGADALSAASLRSGGTSQLTLNPMMARQAAQQVLDAAAATGDVDIQGNAVSVTAHVTESTAILSIIGVDRMGGTATATAQAVPTDEGGG
jgi:hypothetical protein